LVEGLKLGNDGEKKAKEESGREDGRTFIRLLRCRELDKTSKKRRRKRKIERNLRVAFNRNQRKLGATLSVGKDRHRKKIFRKRGGGGRRAISGKDGEKRSKLVLGEPKRKTAARRTHEQTPADVLGKVGKREKKGSKKPNEKKRKRTSPFLRETEGKL